MQGALNGVRILDVTTVLNGPYCGGILGQLGAEVLKIEPPGGELLRRVGPFIGGESYYFIMTNTSKKFVTLNLKHEKGKRILMELVKRSDVFLENYSPGAMQRLGAGYEDLRKVNPRIIYASSTGYGYTGPNRDLPAFDYILQAMSGAMSFTGYPECPPTLSKVWWVDLGAALTTATAILAALYNREKTGRGQRIDIAMYDVAVSFIHTYIAQHLVGGKTARIGNRDWLTSPCNIYKAKDGQIYIIGTPWERFAQAIGGPDLAANPLYQSGQDRIDRQDELDKIVQEWVGTRTVAEAYEVMKKAGIPSALVRTVDQAMEDPQTLAREMLVEAEHPTLGKIKVVGSPLKLSETPGKVTRPGCPPGCDNREVYGALLGLTDTEMEELRRENVI